MNVESTAPRMHPTQETPAALEAIDLAPLNLKRKREPEGLTGRCTKLSRSWPSRSVRKDIEKMETDSDDNELRIVDCLFKNTSIDENP